MLCMHDSGSHNSNAAYDNAGINNEGDDDDDVEQFFLFVFHVWGGVCSGTQGRKAVSKCLERRVKRGRKCL